SALFPAEPVPAVAGSGLCHFLHSGMVNPAVVRPRRNPTDQTRQNGYCSHPPAPAVRRIYPGPPDRFHLPLPISRELSSTDLRHGRTSPSDFSRLYKTPARRPAIAPSNNSSPPRALQTHDRYLSCRPVPIPDSPAVDAEHPAIRPRKSVCL